MHNLTDWGWSPQWQRALAPVVPPGGVPGRIIGEHGSRLSVITELGVIPCVSAGRMRVDADVRAHLPVVGDWVGLHMRAPGEKLAMIAAFAPRTSLLIRRAAGREHNDQPLAANADLAIIMMGLDGDYNVRRLERQLALVTGAHLAPVVVLTKADIAPDLTAQVAEATHLAQGVRMLVTSAPGALGLADFAALFTRGATVVLLGSSGVGKSTLLNHLLGEERQRVQEVRGNDSRGRHTTTHRELFRLPGGALVIDTPGLRELQLWESDAGFAEAFARVTEVAADCRFHDCTHTVEPGCAVAAAVEDGRLDADHVLSYQKLHEERRRAAGLGNIHAHITERRRWKNVSRWLTQREQREGQTDPGWK